MSLGPHSGLRLQDQRLCRFSPCAPDLGSYPDWVIYPYQGELRLFPDRAGTNGATRKDNGVVSASGFHGSCMGLVPLPGFPVTCNQDVAEAFASNVATERGDLVALVRGVSVEPTVRKATQPYDADLVGVVSASPGLVFDHGETIMAGEHADLITAEKTVVGIVGRVAVKASTEDGPIAVGDALTSSSTPGAAMKATKAGMIVGRALEPAVSDGAILMWLQPGHYIPPDMEERLNALLAAAQ